MVQWLNKKLVLCASVLLAGSLSAQIVTGGYGADDYKDPKTHEKFRKRRVAVSQWQINQLKSGALVVRLQFDSLLVNELKKRGDADGADRITLQQKGLNLNIMRSFINEYKFSKVYFINSRSSDKLAEGARSGIFLDTTLKVNPAITMSEKFYLLAEPDYIYNSSIGFVREDSARYVTEVGNPSGGEFPIVIKNKFGHQLKNPFPYTTNKFVFVKVPPTTEIAIDGRPYLFNVGGLAQFSSKSPTAYNGKNLEVTIPRMFTYNVYSLYVAQVNANLEEFYRSSSGFSERSRDYNDAKPFFY